MNARVLTIGEIELASAFFGNISGSFNSKIINYGNIRIDSSYFMADGSAIVNPNLITFDSGVYYDDFSVADINARALFLHEIAHQWQYSQGIDVRTAAAVELITSGFDPYNYSAVFNGTPFRQLPVEAQATILRDIYYRSQGFIPEGSTATLEQLKSVVPPELVQAVERLGEPSVYRELPRRPLCFAAGTLIAMADGTQKPVEQITPDDMVMSFDATADNGRGALVPGKVVRLFRNTSPHMLDFHGTRVTPGHAYLCGDGPHEGRFRPLIDVIRDDGAVVKADGSLIRASTGCDVGSRGDAFVDLEVLRLGRDTRSGAEVREVVARGLVRAGTTLISETGLAYTLLGLLDTKGWTLRPDGLIVQGPGGEPAPLRSLLPALPKPEDYILARSGLTLADLYDDPRQDERPVPPSSRTMHGHAPAAPADGGILRASGPRTEAPQAAPSAGPGPSRKMRRKLEAEQRKQGRVRKHAGMTVH